jgi:hypothetical protein
MREQRERQQVALNTIAERTKIKVSLLEAMERDDVSQWPSGIFRRAFIRAYAHAIGLEPDTIVREFLALHPDPPEVFAALNGNGNGDDGRATDGAPMRFKYFVASAIGSVSRLRARSNHKAEPMLDFSAPELAKPKEPTLHATSEIAVQVDAVRVSSDAIDDDEPTVKMTPPVVPAEMPPAPAPPIPAESAPAEAEPAVQLTPTAPPVPLHEFDLMAVAHLCTEFACVQTTGDVPPLLGEMTKLLDAVGVIVWMWDPIASELRPALAHGYSHHVVAQLPRVARDTNNATAAAFRTGRTCIVKGDDLGNGALAVPVMGPGGCVGVLAIELPEQRETKEPVRALAMILAAQLGALIGTAEPAEAPVDVLCGAPAAPPATTFRGYG